MDAQADEIAAFLVPLAYNPPLASGDSSLPADLSANAVAQLTVSR
jgi:hypothetical protein